MVYGFPGGSVVKNPIANNKEMQETWVQILGSETSSEVGDGNPLQYSCWENPMDRGAWWTTAHRTAKNWTQLSMNTH